MSLIVGRGGSLLLTMVGTWVVTTSVVKSQLSGGQNSKNLPRFTDSRLTPTVLPLFLDVSLFHHLWQKSFGFSRWGALQGVQLQKSFNILRNCLKCPRILPRSRPSLVLPVIDVNLVLIRKTVSADINQNKVVCHTFPFNTSSSSSRLRLGLKFISFACSPKASSGVRSLLALFNRIAGD